MLPPADTLLGMPEPAGDLRVGVSRRALDLAGHHIVASGGMCHSIDASSAAFVRRDVLDDLLGVPLGTGDDELLLVVKPQHGIGFEIGTGLRMTEVIGQELPGHPLGVLTGPNLAREIAGGMAAASVIAMEDEVIVGQLQRLFRGGLFRVYRNTDLVGSELGGALKNVFAIAAGMGDGLGAGDNTRSALLTRSIAEMTRLGVALGGKAETFAGLTGLGDLITTCTSPQSRNRTVGFQLGQGRALPDIIEGMNQVAEGVKSCAPIYELAQSLNLEVPIISEVYKVIHEGRSPQAAFRGLLRRGARSEAEPG